MIEGREYKELIAAFREYRGTDYFNLIHSIMENRLTNLFYSLLDEPNETEVFKKIGAAKEVRKLLDDMYPRIIQK